MSDDIDALWLAMADIYGHRWVSSYGVDPRKGAGDTWAHGLSGLAGWQISEGVSACIAGAFSWPPTLPEFRALCLGVPTFAAVRADSDSVMPFTILVWQNLDGFRYRQASSDQSDRLLREAYDLAREYVMRGGPLPELPEGHIAHEKRKPEPVSPERAAEHMERIRSMLDRKSQAAGDDS